MSIENGYFDRCKLLLGEEKMQDISSKKVIVFGVGGVGSWCAESLIRSGVENLTIVDSDRICASNINRQLMATSQTIGKVKVDALKERLKEINPNAKICSIRQIYNKQTAEQFEIEKYDYIIDCIDSLQNKVLLLLNASGTNSVLFSSMGAALKIDPSKIKVSEFAKIEGCPLAAAIRKRMRRGKTFVSKKFLCVFSPEVLDNKGKDYAHNVTYTPPNLPNSNQDNLELNNHNWNEQKAQINGTLSHITAIFGFTLAGLVIKDINGG